MSTRVHTLCDSCHAVIDCYQGATINLHENFVIGDGRKVNENGTDKKIDLCAKCYEPIAKEFRSALWPKVSNGM